MRIIGLMLAFLITLQCASAQSQRQQIAFGALPKEVQDHVNDVRRRCKEYYKEAGNPEFTIRDQMDGISVIDLNGDGSTDLLVANESLCYGHNAGVNCSNRGCDILIWKQTGPRSWRRIFREHAHREFLSIDQETKRFNWMAISIYAGDPRCRPKPGRDYTSGQSCDLLVYYRNRNWEWRR